MTFYLSCTLFFLEMEQLHQYTPSQLKALVAQRKNVVDVIAASITNSALAEHDIVEVYRASSSENSQPESISPLTPLPCNWTCCHACRRQLSDRAWISLNAVVHQGYHLLDHLMETNTDWPPISHRDLVRNLGLREPVSAGKSRRLRTFDKRDFSDLEEEGEEEEEDEDAEREARLRNLRLSLKKAFKGRLMSTITRPRRPSIPPPIPAPPPMVQLSYTLLPLIVDGSHHSDSGIVGTKGILLDQEKDVLDVASKIELPGEDGKDDGLELEFQAEPVEVEGGIAVTEEAVMQRTADVLTQV